MRNYCTIVDDIRNDVVANEVLEVFVLHLLLPADLHLVLFVPLLLVKRLRDVLASLLVVLILLVVELVAPTQLKLVVLVLGVCLVLAVLVCIVLAFLVGIVLSISVGIGLSPFS